MGFLAWVLFAQNLLLPGAGGVGAYDGALLTFEMVGGETVRRYKPGQSVRSGVLCKLAGVFADPSSPICTVHFPDGSLLQVSPVQDTQGQWHADYVIPFTVSTNQSSVIIERWRSTGASPGQNATKEFTVIIDPLFF